MLLRPYTSVGLGVPLEPEDPAMEEASKTLEETECLIDRIDFRLLGLYDGVSLNGTVIKRVTLLRKKLSLFN